MGKKVYMPIMKAGNHLLRSKDNPNRVRGLSRDEHNQNPDIPEWEEYDLDDLQADNANSIYPQKDREVYLTPEQEEFAQKIGAALGEAIVVFGDLLFRKVIAPWWKGTAWPWIKEKIGKKTISKTPRKAEIIQNKRLKDISSQIDAVFEQFCFEMDELEAKEHMMKLVYHMLGLVNEIRIISNSRIMKECHPKELQLERQQESERFLAECVVLKLNQLLSKETLRLDLNTSRELFALTGGGVRLNGEYVPVQVKKIEDALKKMSN